MGASRTSTALAASAPPDLDPDGFEIETQDWGPVTAVRVRTGRHVDCVTFAFGESRSRSFGNPDGGEEQEPFELDVNEREYIVRVQGRQNKLLDAVQFVTNLGRVSRWYGGAGGEPFQRRAGAGMMVVGLESGPGDFCPPVRGLRLIQATKPRAQASLRRLLLHPHVRHLIFRGNPSVWKGARKGKPSVLRLLLARRAIMLRVMMRGNPSFMRLILDGEQRREPQSLLRRLCTGSPEDHRLSALQMMSCRDPRDRTSKSINQLLLTGSPSVARQFFGTRKGPLQPLVQLLFERDLVNGFPSLVHLLTMRDELDGAEQPSVFEAVLQGEQFLGTDQTPPPLELGLSLRLDDALVDQLVPEEDDKSSSQGGGGDSGEGTGARSESDAHGPGRARTSSSRSRLRISKDGGRSRASTATPRAAPQSLMRLLLSGSPSLMALILAGEREGRESLVRRFVEDKHGNGLSLARLVLSSFEDHKGHRPALSTYIFGGENLGRPSLLRMFLAGEGRDQPSLMRLFLAKPVKGPRPGLFRAASGLRGQGHAADAKADAKAAARRSLMDLLTSGTPSIADLFFQGEMEGEDSLARLMFGTCVDFKDGYLRLGDTLSAGNENGVSLMQWMLVGEEDGGPGISFMRLLLFGEGEDGMSLLRLMLTSEDTSETSLLRILMTTFKAVLVASKTRPHQLRNGEWRATVDRIGKAVLGTGGAADGSLRAQINRLAGSLNPSGEQFKLFLSALSAVPSRGKEFQELWRKQWLRVADEIESAGQRAKQGSVWDRLGPTWSRMAQHVARENWTQLATEVASLTSRLNAVHRLASRLRTGGNKTASLWSTAP